MYQLPWRQRNLAAGFPQSNRGASRKQGKTT